MEKTWLLAWSLSIILSTVNRLPIAVVISTWSPFFCFTTQYIYTADWHILHILFRVMYCTVLLHTSGTDKCSCKQEQKTHMHACTYSLMQLPRHASTSTHSNMHRKFDNTPQNIIMTASFYSRYIQAEADHNGVSCNVKSSCSCSEPYIKKNYHVKQRVAMIKSIIWYTFNNRNSVHFRHHRFIIKSIKYYSILVLTKIWITTRVIMKVTRSLGLLL